MPEVGRSATVSLAVATNSVDLHLRLLGDLQSVVDLDSEIPDGAFKFRVPKQELNGPEIPGPPVNQRGFRAPQRMRAVGRRVQPNRPHPRPDDSGVLAGRNMRRLRYAARKEELVRFQMRLLDPRRDRVPRLLGDCKLHRTP